MKGRKGEGSLDFEDETRNTPSGSVLFARSFRDLRFILKLGKAEHQSGTGMAVTDDWDCKRRRGTVKENENPAVILLLIGPCFTPQAAQSCPDRAFLRADHREAELRCFSSKRSYSCQLAGL